MHCKGSSEKYTAGELKKKLYRPEINPRILALLRVKEAEWALDHTGVSSQRI
jgi:hypothetical protein